MFPYFIIALEWFDNAGLKSKFFYNKKIISRDSYGISKYTGVFLKILKKKYKIFYNNVFKILRRYAIFWTKSDKFVTFPFNKYAIS